MTKPLIVVIEVVIVGWCVTTLLLLLKEDEAVMQVGSLPLTCERCYHMKVHASDNKDIVGATILPISGKIDIEALIDQYMSDNNSICLLGKPYIFNFNILSIVPDGRRVEIIEDLPLSRCENL
ncbi:hypothetical protein [Agarilytica rhodophyticola]|uniref:hypothetical protein n=1 Tax=Agarilytica rhodophyticola TaxID=1737490 RepID=UPI000CD80CC2|nr:hypothetical protein [Agarilytica rhodophyticola]